MTNQIQKDKTATVELPAEYWRLILGILGRFVERDLRPHLEQLVLEHVKVAELPSDEQAVVVAPFMAINAIIAALVKVGAMTAKEGQELMV